MRTRHVQITRRHALIAGGVAALAANPLSRRDAAAMSIQSGGGIAGGGEVEIQGGTASFSVFGSRFVVEGEDEPFITGSFVWRDSNGVSLVGSEVTAYGPVEGEENARQMAGFVAMDGEVHYPFTLTLVDGGGAGEGKDSVTLSVLPSTATPAAGDTVYRAEAALTTGDLQLLTFTFPE